MAEINGSNITPFGRPPVSALSAPVVKKKDTQSNGTAARLCTTHKDPNTSPTPGANYGPHTPAELAGALNSQSAYACTQWQAGKGVVGPNNSEDGGIYKQYNEPADPQFADYQAFGYQHDLQATDAEKQAADRSTAYSLANKKSAIEGMYVIYRGGTVSEALKKTKEVFGSYGFTVRESY